MTTIADFLVGLGFKIDKESFQAFEQNIGKAEKAIFALGGTVSKIAAALGIAAPLVELALGRMSSRYETLYYQSQRTGASVAGIKSLQYAFGQIGLTSEQAGAAIEGFAAALRLPGKAAFAETLGGTSHDPVIRLEQLVEHWKALNDAGQFFVAKSQASVFGFDETTLLHMINNFDRLKESVEEYQHRLRAMGLDTEKVAQASVDYQRELKEFTSSWQILTDLWGSKTIPAAERIVEALILMSQGGHWDALLNIHSDSLFNLLRGKGIGHSDSTLNRILGRGDYDPDPANRTVARFEDQGWTHAQALGMVKRLKIESGLNPRAIGDSGLAYGIAQWHPDRQRDFERWAGHSIRESTSEEQNNFINYELTEGNERAAGLALRRARTPDEAYDIFTRQYERPAGTSVTLHAKTDIHVSGGNARETANLVAGEQDRIAGDQVRNLAGAVR